MVPVRYEFDGRFLYFCGHHLGRSLKFRNILENSRVALVVDDLVSGDFQAQRGVLVRGIAEIIGEKDCPYVGITFLKKAS